MLRLFTKKDNRTHLIFIILSHATFTFKVRERLLILLSNRIIYKFNIYAVILSRHTRIDGITIEKNKKKKKDRGRFTHREHFCCIRRMREIPKRLRSSSRDLSPPRSPSKQFN